MQQGNGRWRRGRWRRDSLEEVRRFLGIWYFYISASGQLYVRPLRPTVSRRDVQDFLDRLDLLGDDCLPESMTFDFTKSAVSSRQLCSIVTLLRRYASEINSAFFFISENPRSRGVALIMRSISRALQLAPN